MAKPVTSSAGTISPDDMPPETPSAGVPPQPAEVSGLASSRSPRWRLGGAILVVSIIVEAGVWVGWEPDRTMQMFFSGIVGAAAGGALAFWWCCLSRLSARTRWQGVGIAGVLVLLLAGLVRIEAYSGAFEPQFAFRWSRTDREIAEEYWAQAGLGQTRPAPAKLASELDATDETESELDWPQFRGPLRDGVVRHGSLRTAEGKLPDWQRQPPRLLWRHPVGAGMGSFAVVGRRAVTLEQRGENEAVVCYDLETGGEQWAHRYAAHYQFEIAGEGPRSTPTISQGRVYTLGATGHLQCVRLADGRPLWSRETLADAKVENLPYGTAVSPLVFRNLVIVNPGGKGQRSVIAYHGDSGEEVWATGESPAAYVSPQVVTLEGVPQILIYDGLGPKGLQPQTGSELWRFDWHNTAKINCSQPLVVDAQRLLISSGYGRGSLLLKVKHAAEGWQPTEVWSSRELKLKFNPGVLRDEYVYGLDEGILECVELNSHRRQWKGGRYGYGQTLLVEDLLLVQAESGEVAVVAANPEEFREITRFPALHNKTWNVPVICRGRLLVRNESEAACFELPPAP